MDSGGQTDMREPIHAYSHRHQWTFLNPECATRRGDLYAKAEHQRRTKTDENDYKWMYS